MSLAKKLLKVGSKDNQSSILSKSDFFDRSKRISLPIYAMNIAHSGSIFGGFSAGLIQLAGKSKHFKSGFMLVHAAAFQAKHPEGLILFYDSEFGSDSNYFENAGVDSEKVIHIPLRNIEDFKFDIMQKLEALKEERASGDKTEVLILVDSIGNLASKKETQDALDGKSVADMTRAKSLKGLWRMVTPELTLLGISCIAINHVYDTMDLYSKAVVGGGAGNMYASNSVFIIGKRQLKDGKELQGYSFVLNAEKSRDIKEQSSIPIDVFYDGGISRYSGLLDIALLTGHVTKPKNGWYTRPSVDVEKNWRVKATDCTEFWDPIINDPTFDKAIGEMYKIGGKRLITETLLTESLDVDFDPDTGEIIDLE